MPVVEAMACGVPCVVSSHPSLDEACGNAAVRVDAESAGGDRRGHRARRSPSATSWSPAGLAHARRFDWNETGAIHLQSYADAL